MKQTAVEWLIDELTLYESPKWIQDIIKQAKEMEKEQIVDAYVYGSAYGIDFQEGLSPINYYKETYESNN
jgi:hypothetical protein